MKYKGVSSSAGQLRDKVRQEELSPAVLEAIRSELGTPDMAQRVLEHVDICITVLVATGGRMEQKLQVEDQLLVQYAQEVLHHDPEDFHSVSLRERVHLKHLKALQQLLVRMTSSGDMGLPAKFCRPLEAKLEDELRMAVQAGLREPVVRAMEELMSTNLTSGKWSANLRLVDWLGYQTVDGDALINTEWFRHFPKALELQHTLATYRVLFEHFM